MIRCAACSDVDAVSQIYDDLHHREESGLITTGWVRGIYPTRVTAQQAQALGELFVLEEDGRVLAAARINRTQGEEYARAKWSADAPPEQVMVLHTLVVSPAAMGMGLGTRFVAFYEQYAREHGCRFLRMDTNERNAVARALYRKLGYSEVDVVSCVFNGIKDVRLVCLEKEL